MHIREPRSLLLVLATIVVAMVTGDIAAQSACGWTKVTPAPLARRYHVMAYDAGRGVSVLFGGQGATGYLADTWEWNGQSWKQGLAGPSARVATAMAYDSARGACVLFGGWIGNNTIGDTWEWNGATWSKRTPSAPTPPARNLHAMAYDSGRKVCVMFGGWDGLNGLADTWEWDGSSWARRATAGPSTRRRFAMAYDSARGVTVLFGGWDGTNVLGDTWEWNGTKWTQVSSQGPARQRHAMAYDSSRGVAVLYGGGGPNNSTYYDDTWEWDGLTWTKAAYSGPPKRYYHALTFDSRRHVTVLHGGDSSGALSDTWEYSPNRTPASVSGAGSLKIGTRVNLALVAGLCDAGLVYQAASSLGMGPTFIGSRQIGLSLDNLLFLSVWQPAPTFSGYLGRIDAQGQAAAAIDIPLISALVGVRIHTAFLTLSSKAPTGIRSISNTYSFAIR